MARNFIFFVSVKAIVLLSFSVWAADSNDHPSIEQINSLYQSFLDSHLSKGQKNGLPANMIDYRAVQEDDRLHTLLSYIESFPKSELKTNADKIAFYLNAYNILAIAMVTENWPLMKLKSLGNFMKPVWTHPTSDVCGEKMTLRKLEHEILRKLDDPRIHFALNCASMSCPDLRDEPYVAVNIDAQLQEQTEIFLSQDGKGLSVVEGAKIKLSPIFKWFDEDFESDGGVEEFVSRYLPKRDQPWEIVGYLEYDWSVNCVLLASDRNKLKRKAGNTWFN